MSHAFYPLDANNAIHPQLCQAEMSPDAVSGPLGKKLALAEHNRNFFPTVLKAGKSSCRQIRCLVRSCSLVQSRHLPGSSHDRRGLGAPLVPLL